MTIHIIILPCLKGDSSLPSVVGIKRTKELTLQQIAVISEGETESSRKLRRTEFGIRETHNVLFSLSTDFFKYVTIINFNMQKTIDPLPLRFSTRCY